MSFEDIVTKMIHRLPIRHYIIPMPDRESPYLERFILKDGPADRVYLHIIYGSDADRDPHDHPFDFQSTIVWGSYLETEYVKCHRCGGTGKEPHEGSTCPKCADAACFGHLEVTGVYRAGETNVKKADALHRLTIIDGPVVTLVRCGPKVREWGFQTDEGWEHHASYIARKFPGAQPTEID